MATCPRCGADASGNFCSTCGAVLKQTPCPTCGATPEPGARFCNNCGAPLGAGAGRAAGAGAGAAAAAAGASRGGARRGGASRAKEAAEATADGTTSEKQSQTGWWVAGVFFIGMVLILALPILRREGPPSETSAPPGATGGGTPPDLSTMTPEEAANRLFNRVMAAAEDGNTAEAQRFLPMAIQAHEQARPLDADGLFHLSLLQQYGEDYTSSLATAREVLESNPDHLLGLAAAGDAAKALGDSVAAREYYSRFLEFYDAEVAKGLQEYQEHQYNLSLGRQNAVAFTRP
jgi:tetratricopeptide (TPR) repeat protein